MRGGSCFIAVPRHSVPLLGFSVLAHAASACHPRVAQRRSMLVSYGIALPSRRPPSKVGVRVSVAQSQLLRRSLRTNLCPSLAWFPSPLHLPLSTSHRQTKREQFLARGPVAIACRPDERPASFLIIGSSLRPALRTGAESAAPGINGTPTGPISRIDDVCQLPPQRTHLPTINR